MTKNRTLEIRHLRAFVTVAEQGSLRRAAEKLNISQPPLGRQIKFLEEELSVDLFERTNKGLRMTLAGREFMSHAKDILQRSEGAIEQVRLVNEGRLGKLTIRYTDDFTYGLLPALISKFCSRHPDISLSLELSYSKQIIPDVLSGAVDIGFVLAPLPADANALSAHQIGSLQLELAVPASHQHISYSGINLRQFASETFIAASIHPDSGFYIRTLSLFQNAGINPHVIEGIWPGEMIVNFVEAGLGVAIVTRGAIPAGRSGVRLSPILDEGACVELLAIWRGTARERATVKLFLDEMGAS